MRKEKQLSTWACLQKESECAIQSLGNRTHKNVWYYHKFDSDTDSGLELVAGQD